MRAAPPAPLSEASRRQRKMYGHAVDPQAPRLIEIVPQCAVDGSVAVGMAFPIPDDPTALPQQSPSPNVEADGDDALAIILCIPVNARLVVCNLRGRAPANPTTPQPAREKGKNR